MICPIKCLNTVKRRCSWIFKTRCRCFKRFMNFDICCKYIQYDLHVHLYIRRIKSRRQSVIKKCTLKGLFKFITPHKSDLTSASEQLAWCPKPNTSPLSLHYVRGHGSTWSRGQLLKSSRRLKLTPPASSSGTCNHCYPSLFLVCLLLSFRCDRLPAPSLHEGFTLVTRTAHICWRADFNSDATVMLNSILSLKNKHNEPNVSCSCRDTNSQTRSQSDLSSECSTISPKNKVLKINAYFNPDLFLETRVELILQSVPSNHRRRREHDRVLPDLVRETSLKSSEESTWLQKLKKGPIHESLI